METTTYKNILATTDFSDLSENAIKTAAYMGQRQNARLILLHVIENPFLHETTPSTLWEMNYYPDLLVSARKNLKRVGNNIRRKYNIKVSEIITYGDVAIEICQAAKKNITDLIIMGTHGISGFRRFFVGSSVYRVIKHSPCPVMTIPAEGDWITFKKILFPVRYIPDALEKYDYIRPIIRKNDSILYILGLTKDKPNDQVIDIFALVNQLDDELREDQVRSETSYSICDDFAAKVLETSESKEVDLIVLTSTLDFKIKEFFIGPYSQQIINQAKIPVLAIRPYYPSE
jgi:nucleotide-binding universal stress UspA family protein